MIVLCKSNCTVTAVIILLIFGVGETVEQQENILNVPVNYVGVGSLNPNTNKLSIKTTKSNAKKCSNK